MEQTRSKLLFCEHVKVTTDCVCVCSKPVSRKSSVSAADLITCPFECAALHSNQVTGTPSSRPDSFPSVSNSPFCFVSFLFSMSIDAVNHTLIHTHIHCITCMQCTHCPFFFLSRPGQVTGAWKQLPTNTELRSNTAASLHATHFWQPSFLQGPSLCLCPHPHPHVYLFTLANSWGWQVGAGKRSKTSDTLNKETDKHIPGRKPAGQRWQYRRVQLESLHWNTRSSKKGGRGIYLCNVFPAVNVHLYISTFDTRPVPFTHSNSLCHIKERKELKLDLQVIISAS